MYSRNFSIVSYICALMCLKNPMSAISNSVKADFYSIIGYESWQ